MNDHVCNLEKINLQNVEEMANMKDYTNELSKQIDELIASKEADLKFFEERVNFFKVEWSHHEKYSPKWKPVRDIYVVVGQVATVFYFLFFVILIPIIGTFEKKLVKSSEPDWGDDDDLLQAMLPGSSGDPYSDDY